VNHSTAPSSIPEISAPNRIDDACSTTVLSVFDAQGRFRQNPGVKPSRLIRITDSHIIDEPAFINLDGQFPTGVRKLGELFDSVSSNESGTLSENRPRWSPTGLILTGISGAHQPELRRKQAGPSPTQMPEQPTLRHAWEQAVTFLSRTSRPKFRHAHGLPVRSILSCAVQARNEDAALEKALCGCRAGE